MSAVTTFVTEMPGPATVLQLKHGVEGSEVVYRPLALRWQHDPSAVALTRLLTHAELAELVVKLARAIEHASEPAGEATHAFPILSDGVRPLLLLEGGRSAPDGPYPVHLQLVDADGRSATRRLRAGEAAELLETLTRIRAAAPAELPEQHEGLRWWEQLDGSVGARPDGDDPEAWARYAAAAPTREEFHERLVEALGAGVSPTDMAGMPLDELTEALAAAEAASRRGPLPVTRDFGEGSIVGSMVVLMQLAQDLPTDLPAWIEQMQRALADQAAQAGMTESDLTQLLTRFFAGKQPDG